MSEPDNVTQSTRCLHVETHAGLDGGQAAFRHQHSEFLLCTQRTEASREAAGAVGSCRPSRRPPSALAPPWTFRPIATYTIRHSALKHFEFSTTQAQREAAIRTGNFLDLTAEANVSDEAMKAIQAEVEAKDNREVAQRRATRAQEQQQARAEEQVRFRCLVLHLRL